MDLTSPKTTKELLEKYEKKPNKILGQNFLIDKNVLSKIISAANLKKTDTVLEVGPGIGTLTQELAKQSGKVIAIEKDKAMADILKNVLESQKVENVEIITGDILKILTQRQCHSGLDPESTPTLDSRFRGNDSEYKIVANIPYYLTSPLIRMFLESKNQPEKIILLIQKEVAQRICSKPGDMSLLAVSVQFYAKPEIIDYVSKNCFWPAPKVDSAIIKITPQIRSTSDVERNFNKIFFKIVKAGFSQPRKQLANNLAKTLKLDKKTVENWLLKNNMNPTQRAETLAISDWQNLAKSYSQFDIDA